MVDFWVKHFAEISVFWKSRSDASAKYQTMMMVKWAKKSMSLENFLQYFNFSIPYGFFHSLRRFWLPVPLPSTPPKCPFKIPQQYAPRVDAVERGKLGRDYVAEKEIKYMKWVGGWTGWLFEGRKENSVRFSMILLWGECVKSIIFRCSIKCETLPNSGRRSLEHKHLVS